MRGKQKWKQKANRNRLSKTHLLETCINRWYWKVRYSFVKKIKKLELFSYAI